jgi:hypothetical protein
MRKKKANKTHEHQEQSHSSAISSMKNSRRQGLLQSN